MYDTDADAVPQPAESAEIGLAVLHGFNPETGRVTTDTFREDASAEPSPWHRAVRLRDSVRDDFPGWIWSIGQNPRSRELMTAENMRQLGFGAEPASAGAALEPHDD